MIDDPRAITVDVPHRRRKICLVLATVEHRDLVSAADQLPYDTWPNEDRSPNNENATHGPILRVRDSSREAAPAAIPRRS
jgi:hypothetical protein